MKTNVKKQNIALRVLQGMLVGAFCIIPGASGGVMAVSMGLYEPCVDALYGFFRHFKTEGKRNFLFLLPLGIGGVTGLFLCSFGLEWLLDHAYEPFMFVLIGMVLGGLPAFFREANAEGFKAKYLLATLAGFALMGALAILSNKTFAGAGLPFNAGTEALGGALVVAGTMLPGLSTSFVLMLLGIYKPLLTALTHLQWDALLFAGLGGLLGGALMLLFVRKMFKRFHGYAYYAMLGFLLATLPAIFPGFSAQLALWDILLCAAGFGLSWWMAKIDKRDPLTTDALDGIMDRTD